LHWRAKALASGTPMATGPLGVGGKKSPESDFRAPHPPPGQGFRLDAIRGGSQNRGLEDWQWP